MNTLTQPWQESFRFAGDYAVAQISAYFPRILGAILVILVGLFLARLSKRVVQRALGAIKPGKLIAQTPVELFLKNAEIGQHLEDLIGTGAYWIVLFIVLQTVASILGLTPVVRFFEQVFSYLPHIFVAFFIFLFGVILAGVVESLVKATLKSLDAKSARLFAKVASYVVVTIASLAAIAELGIARDFILILFVGVVTAFSLAAGIAFGLGGQTTVRKMLEQWEEKS